MSCAGGPDLIQDGLVLCLDAADKQSYAGSGTTWRDLSGNNNNGTLTNGPTFSSANGGSIVFDGTNDIVTMSSPINIPNTQASFTAEIWFNISSLAGQPAARQILFAGNDGNSYQIEIRNFTLRMGKWGGGILVDSLITPIVNTWYQCVVTTDGTTHKIYNNGRLINTNSTAPQSGTVGRIVLGSYTLVGGTEQFNGLMSNLKIYNKLLNDTEILQNYNALKGRFRLT